MGLQVTSCSGSSSNLRVMVQLIVPCPAQRICRLAHVPFVSCQLETNCFLPLPIWSHICLIVDGLLPKLYTGVSAIKPSAHNCKLITKADARPVYCISFISYYSRQQVCILLFYPDGATFCKY